MSALFTQSISLEKEENKRTSPQTFAGSSTCKVDHRESGRKATEKENKLGGARCASNGCLAYKRVICTFKLFFLITMIHKSSVLSLAGAWAGR
jgi:hypothetical protein